MITAIVLTKNEEKNIAACLNSLSWCDQSIVIDDNSEDKTVDMARKKGAEVFIHKMNDDFAEQRNFGLSKAKGEWVLFVDADERIPQPLWYEIMQHTNDPIQKFSGFYLKRIDVMWGRELRYGETGSIKLLRLAKRDAGKWEGYVHETWKITGKTAVLQNSLSHYSHQTVQEFLRDINYYTVIRAKELYKKKVGVTWLGIIVFPLAKFIINYFFRLGFLDGLPGLVLALMMSFHSFLVRGKLWLLWQRKQKI